MTKWEYYRIKTPNAEELKYLGERGWELAAIERDYTYVFKRPLEHLQ